jgi:hypothetical protein
MIFVSRETILYQEKQKTPFREPFAVDVGCEREGYGVAFATFIKSLVIGG